MSRCVRKRLMASLNSDMLEIFWPGTGRCPWPSGTVGTLRDGRNVIPAGYRRVVSCRDRSVVVESCFSLVLRKVRSPWIR
jgi:hypothetical protein